MSKILIDVRGLICPEPLMAFTEAAKRSDAFEMEIRFDCAAARDNIARAASSLGWQVASVAEAPDHTVMNLTKAS
ncbi:MAG: sulfurtransferase TusA family protein [Deltaproteobacteria bacterium]|jgi:TusA-related sulfurtransferase|nr:sulfurtransferase TusA family protein [Deltaproteobacteria bacterium]